MKVSLYNGSERLVLTNHPFKLSSEINLSGLGANIVTVDNNSDGANYLKSNFNTRDVDIEGYIRTTGMDESTIQKNKNLLYKFFNPKVKVTVEFEDESTFYSIVGYPTSFPTFETGLANKNYNFQRFLLQMTCTDPFIYKKKKTVIFADVLPTFSFPMEFNSVTFGEKSNGLIQTLYNSGVMECPVEITFTATNEIDNPYFLNVYTGEQIKLNTTLESGDVVTINTGRKKEISRIRNGVKEVFYYALDIEDSTFIQLQPGDNVFRFGADVNETYLQVQVSYREKIGGI